MKIAVSILGVAVAMSILPANAQNKIKIGVSTPITGPVAFGSLQERRGLDLALDEINKQGGVLGRQIELVYEDNQCNPSVSVTVTNKLIEQGVPAVLGAQCSSAVLAAMPVFQKASIPLVSSIATNPKISEQSGVGGNPWIFRLNPSDRELSVANTKYLKAWATSRRSRSLRKVPTTAAAALMRLQLPPKPMGWKLFQPISMHSVRRTSPPSSRNFAAMAPRRSRSIRRRQTT